MVLLFPKLANHHYVVITHGLVNKISLPNTLEVALLAYSWLSAPSWHTAESGSTHVDPQLNMHHYVLFLCVLCVRARLYVAIITSLPQIPVRFVFLLHERLTDSLHVRRVFIV